MVLQVIRGSCEGHHRLPHHPLQGWQVLVRLPRSYPLRTRHQNSKQSECLEIVSSPFEAIQLATPTMNQTCAISYSCYHLYRQSIELAATWPQVDQQPCISADVQLGTIGIPTTVMCSSEDKTIKPLLIPVIQSCGGSCILDPTLAKRVVVCPNQWCSEPETQSSQR